MFVRVVRLQGKTEKLDDGIRTYREKVLPELRAQKGFKQSYFLVDRKTGMAAGLSWWDDEKTLLDSIPFAGRVIPLVAKAIGATQSPTIENYEAAVVEIPMAIGMK